MRMSKQVLISALLVFASQFAFSAEPPYCNLKTFLSHQVAGPNINRNRTFRFGDATLVAGGIGNSSVSDVVAAAKNMSEPSAFAPQEKYCTWYFNKQNPNAARTFIHKYVSNPDLVTFEIAASPALGLIAMKLIADEYEKVALPTFSHAPINFMSCLQNHKYVAFGCDGQRHRGPTIFAMLLAYSGCSPQTSVDIAVSLWGRNWVMDTTRLVIAQRAYLQGARELQNRRNWQAFFSQR